MSKCKDKLISDILLWTSIHGYTSVGRPAKLTFISSVQTLGTVEKTCQKRWLIGTESESRVKGICAICLDNDNDNDDDAWECFQEINK